MQNKRSSAQQTVASYRPRLASNQSHQRGNAAILGARPRPLTGKIRATTHAERIDNYADSCNRLATAQEVEGTSEGASGDGERTEDQRHVLSNSNSNNYNYQTAQHRLKSTSQPSDQMETTQPASGSASGTHYYTGRGPTSGPTVGLGTSKSHFQSRKFSRNSFKPHTNPATAMAKMGEESHVQLEARRSAATRSHKQASLSGAHGATASGQDEWLPPPKNDNTIYSHDKYQRLRTGNFKDNRPLGSYISTKIDQTISDYATQLEL